MLRSKYTFDHLDITFEKIDDEFIKLENIVLSAFKILDEYEKLVESSKLEQ
jgi:hypothetical protein